MSDEKEVFRNFESCTTLNSLNRKKFSERLVISVSFLNNLKISMNFQILSLTDLMNTTKSKKTSCPSMRKIILSFKRTWTITEEVQLIGLQTLTNSITNYNKYTT
jgi:hypothetical protein